MVGLQPLLPIYFDRMTGRKLGGSRLTVSAMSDSYYEYLLKLWLFKDKPGQRLVPSLDLHSLW